MAKENTPLRFTMSEDGLELRAVDNERGEAVEQLDAKYDGEPADGGVQPELPHRRPGCDLGRRGPLQTQDAHMPAVLRSSENTDFLYLLMPVRVS